MDAAACRRRNNLAAAGKPLEDLDVLVGDLAAPLEVESVERLELFFQPADAGAENDAAAGELIERDELPRRHDRIAMRNDQHHRAILTRFVAPARTPITAIGSIKGSASWLGKSPLAL